MARRSDVAQSGETFGKVGFQHDFGERIAQLLTRKLIETGMSRIGLAAGMFPETDPIGEKRKGDVSKWLSKPPKSFRAPTLNRMIQAFTINGVQHLTLAEIDACRTAKKIEIARYADLLLDLLKGAVAQTGISTGLAHDLATRFAEGNPNTFDTALNEMARAIEVAEQQAKLGALPSNTDAAVDAVIAVVDRLNEDEGLEAGSALVMAELDRMDAQHMRLIDKGLARDVDGAVPLDWAKTQNNLARGGSGVLRQGGGRGASGSGAGVSGSGAGGVCRG